MSRELQSAALSKAYVKAGEKSRQDYYEWLSTEKRKSRTLRHMTVDEQFNEWIHYVYIQNNRSGSGLSKVKKAHGAMVRQDPELRNNMVNLWRLCEDGRNYTRVNHGRPFHGKY